MALIGKIGDAIGVLKDSYNEVGAALDKDSSKYIFDKVASKLTNVLLNSDFISRSIGSNASYDGLMFIIRLLGHEPNSLLGNDYPYIFDHMRRVYALGEEMRDSTFPWPKFTFYKGAPNIRFADPYNDSDNFRGWFDNFLKEFSDTYTIGNEFSYAESNDDTQNKLGTPVVQAGANAGVANGNVRSVDWISTNLQNDLVSKTNDLFKAGKLRTLVARFHTDSSRSKDPTNPMQTAISSQYGMSHGRNLLKLKKSYHNGYDNPYCRVWTYHHQYHTLDDAIRPFENEDQTQLGNRGKWDGAFRTVGDDTFPNGSTKLAKYSVLNKNGMVNIAPTAKIQDYFMDKLDSDAMDAISPKNCMFSIENLAWKKKGIDRKTYDDWGLSAEQKGPLGGRIMWFPPYNLKFSENSNVNWSKNEFIGRGEPIYTYVNSEREGSLSFTMLIDHPSAVDYWERGGEEKDRNTDVDNTSSKEQTMLRFFAGCAILKAKPQGNTRPIVEKNEDDEGVKTMDPNKTVADAKPTRRNRCCTVLPK